MNIFHTSPLFLAIAALLGACSSMPKTTQLLEQTRSDYQMAQSNPAVAQYAPLEMQRASDAVVLANAAAKQRDSADEIDKLAYIAKQKIALTQEVAKQKSAEAEITSAGKQRDSMRLEQRTQEADKATARADDLEAQLAALSAKKTERGLVITLGDVLFGTDLARLNSEGMSTAQKLADVLQQNPERTVLIEGFTDDTGSDAHNQALSERRANAVRGVLQDMGVNAARVAMRGYGEAFPVAANDSVSNRQLNRRVEIVVSDATGTAPSARQ